MIASAQAREAITEPRQRAGVDADQHAHANTFLTRLVSRFGTRRSRHASIKRKLGKDWRTRRDSNSRPLPSESKGARFSWLLPVAPSSIFLRLTGAYATDHFGLCP